MKPLELIASARRLIGGPARGRPRQTDLKRAASTAYYAMFHAACRLVANAFVGSSGQQQAQRAWSGQQQAQRAWTQAYRGVDHGHVKDRCKNKSVIGRFPVPLQNFANTFVDLQILRHEADYDPNKIVTRSGVIAEIDRAEQAIKDLRAVSNPDLRAFAVWIVTKERK
jgi:uncharacterized protein (UPF0332 family)